MSMHEIYSKNILLQDYFRVGCAIAILLQHKDLLPGPYQRLAGVYLLYDMYRSDPVAANPFCAVFIHLLQINADEKSSGTQSVSVGIFEKIPSISTQERTFLMQVLLPIKITNSE